MPVRMPERSKNSPRVGSLTIQTMVVFVTALKSATLCVDWRAHCALVEASLRSVFRQSNKHFQVVLVCHEAPVFTIPFDSRLCVIEAGYEPPERSTFSEAAGSVDKFRKLQIAMAAAGQMAPGYVMMKDADDFVHKDLVNYVLSDAHPNGYRVNTGYVWPWRSRWVRSVDGFWQQVGTSAVVNARHIDFPAVDASDGDGCIILTHGHGIIGQELAKRGFPLADIPFTSVLAVAQHGENNSHPVAESWMRRWWRRSHWQQFATRLPHYRYRGAAINEAFGLVGA